MSGKFCLILLVTSSFLFAQETCNRTAVINNQEVLVDINSNTKGEGLRPFLEKDTVALKYLNEYQEADKTYSKSALLGTIGVGIGLVGLFRSDDSGQDIFSKKGMMLAGVVLLSVNYLVAKTQEFENEDKLERSIEEYNKRNLPKIYFMPYKEPQQSKARTRKSSDYGLLAGFTTSF